MAVPADDAASYTCVADPVLAAAFTRASLPNDGFTP
jgi:hypothetical protein